MTPTILVTGRDAQLGFELRRTLSCLGRVVAVGRDEVDFADFGAIRRYIRSERPDILVNAAAYTDVNRAESDRAAAAKINGDAPGILADELGACGGNLIVHFSTDYVFDGRGTVPYTEDDPPSPINAYGESKLRGEQGVLRSGVAHFILRSEWVYATRGNNFLLTILRLARKRKPLRVISDQLGAPTWARMLAETTALLVAQCQRAPASEVKANSGVYHATASGQTSWHGFTQAILQEYQQRLRKAGRPSEWCANALDTLVDIPSSQYPTPARRPNYSLMSNDKLERVFGIRMPGWREQLGMALDEYLSRLDAEE